MKKIYCFLFICLVTQISFAQNAGINGTGATPRDCAMLDILSSNKGLLIPTLALTATGTYLPATGTPVDGLLIYNSTAGVTGTGANGTGYYYWSVAGSRWVNLLDNYPSDYWALVGNTGSTASTSAIGTAANNNFIGTTDNKDFVVATNNLERLRILGSNGTLCFPDLTQSTVNADGMTWYSPAATSYGIFKTAGAWNAPNYQQLQLAWQTGITIDGGSAYGLSGTIMQPTAGNVAIGQTMKGAYNLEVNGTFGFGDGTAGSYRSRTETRADAGLMASQSGFYQTSAPSPSADWPTSSASATANFDGAGNATSWWHMLDVRHSNNANNYAMQLAGGFFDQFMFLRKTNNSASQPWKLVLATSSFGTSGQILTSQGAGAPPTWTAPTSILVYGNNAQSVKLAAIVTNNNTAAYSAIPGISITMTTVHTTFYVFASLTARLDNCSGVAAQFGQCIVDAQLVVDGTVVAEAGGVITDYDNVQGVSTTGTVAFAGIPVTLATGSHTISLQWKPSKLWATNPWCIVINPSAGASDHCVLTVFD